MRSLLPTAVVLILVSPAAGALIAVPDDAPTIQAAIDMAVAGDEVVLADQTFTGPGNRDISFEGKAITVRSAGGAPALCIIDCQDAGIGFVFDHGEGPASILRGVTIANGSTDDDGGGLLVVSASPTFEQCVIRDCTAADGAGALLFNSDAAFTGCTFKDNLAQRGGGMFNARSSPTLQACVFDGNVVVNSPQEPVGGAIYNNNDSNPLVQDCVFTANDALRGGCIYNALISNPTIFGTEFIANTGRYGVAVSSEDGSPTMTDCCFRENVSVGNVGSIVSSSSNSVPIITGCTFEDNQGVNNTSSTGGVVRNFSAEVTIMSCRFESNDLRAVSNAGNSVGVVADCVFIGNTSSSDGGAIVNWSEMLILDCAFLGNQAGGRGGAAFNIGSLTAQPGPQFVNCMFSGNMATNEGGAVCNLRPTAGLVNCSMSGNTASIAGGLASMWGAQSSAVNCILWNNGPHPVVNIPNGSIESETTIASSIVEGGWPGAGNLGLDPMYADADGPDGIPGTEDDDLRLLAGSPAVDVGDNTAVDPCGADLDGNERIFNETVDMGAYELGAPPYCAADTNGDDVLDVNDLVNVILDWGTGGSANGGDVTGAVPGSPPDGVVDVNDLNAVIVAWGPCCGPYQPPPTSSANTSRRSSRTRI